jgi:hypothetical protein
MTGDRKGWAFGERIPETSQYLTILGSYYTRPVLHETFQDAKAALESSPQRDNPYMKLEVRHVTEVGRTVFRITGA